MDTDAIKNMLVTAINEQAVTNEKGVGRLSAFIDVLNALNKEAEGEGQKVAGPEAGKAEATPEG